MAPYHDQDYVWDHALTETIANQSLNPIFMLGSQDVLVGELLDVFVPFPLWPHRITLFLLSVLSVY